VQPEKMEEMVKMVLVVLEDILVLREKKVILVLEDILEQKVIREIKD
jgi:hypothetical protein